MARTDLGTGFTDQQAAEWSCEIAERLRQIHRRNRLMRRTQRSLQASVEFHQASVECHIAYMDARAAHIDAAVRHCTTEQKRRDIRSCAAVRGLDHTEMIYCQTIPAIRAEFMSMDRKGGVPVVKPAPQPKDSEYGKR